MNWINEVSRRGYRMMQGMMDSMGGMMMWGMGLFWLLVVVALVLGIAALIKYVLSSRTGT